MQAHTRTILELAERVGFEHAGPHTCTNGDWYNPRAATSGPCPTTIDLRSLVASARIGDQVVHGAAHYEPAVQHVAAAMLSTPLNELPPEHAGGWVYLARLAVEGLAAWLDTDVPTPN